MTPLRAALHTPPPVVALLAVLALAATGSVQAQSGMVRVPAGSYVPLYANDRGDAVAVAGFGMDRKAVTRREFLAFVTAHSEWQRGSVKAVFADGGYLDEWRGPLDPGAPADLDVPVTSVSWFAARAYCEAQGKRLPTVDEWEYAAAASESTRDATRDPAFIRRLLTLYGARTPNERPDRHAGFRNVYGIDGLHGVVWEWTADFNSVLVSADSREAGGTSRHTNFRAVCAGGAIGATDPSNYPAFMRFAFRASVNGRSGVRALGFRCAAHA